MAKKQNNNADDILTHLKIMYTWASVGCSQKHWCGIPPEFCVKAEEWLKDAINYFPQRNEKDQP